jgi:hypothetical protein
VLGCSASASEDEADFSTPCVGPSCEAPGDASTINYTADVGAADAEPSRENSISPLCGLGCNPDEGVCPEDESDAGAEDESDAGAEDESDAGAEGSAGDVFGCQVRQMAGAPVASCGVAGIKLDGEQCAVAADCAPGFACVRKDPDDLEPARCRRFCCEGLESCEDPGTYCAERLLAGDSDPEDADALSVPVCVRGDNCSLAEPYPCTADSQVECRCPEGTACTVVRADGTTACLPPGDGEAGEPCPCKAGYVCSESTQTCLRLCQTNSTNNECDLGHCQFSAALPEPFGVCTMEGLAE